MRCINNQYGFSYILALTVVVIMGIMLGAAGQYWKTIKQRDLEEEIIFRADQVAEIIYQRLLCKNAILNQGTVGQFLWPTTSVSGTILDDLVVGKEERCMNGSTRKFRLRASAVIDPATGMQWQLVSQIGNATQFAGVKSAGTDEPLRKKFTDIYDSQLLDNKQKYSEWEFTWELKKPVPVAPVKVSP